MTRSSLFILIGVGLFLLGGALLAYAPTLIGIGTTAGVAGLGLAAWGWLKGRDGGTSGTS